MQVDETETLKGFDNLFSAGRFLIVLGLLIFISYPGLVLGTRTFCYHDAGLFSYPVAYYLRDSLRHGQWPLWNPYSHCGTPFLAQWNTLTLYPLSLFYVIWPMPWSLNIFLLGHLLLGGLGMYKLAHHWFGTRLAASVAGLVFAWNGLSIHCLMWPCQTAGLAWMPWVVWLGGRAGKEGGRHIYWAALAGACQMLTGAPETILFTWLMVGVVYIFDFLKSPAGFWMGGGHLLWLVVLVSALSAVQLLPTLDLLSHGDRSSATGTGFWSLPPWGLANFFVPLFHSSPSFLRRMSNNGLLHTTSEFCLWPWPRLRSGGRKAATSSCWPGSRWQEFCWPWGMRVSCSTFSSASRRSWDSSAFQ